jgi:hypothetical protein
MFSHESTRRVMSARRLGGYGTVLLAGAIVLAACSGGGADDADASPTTNDRAVTSTTAPVSDSTALCAIFNQLVASGAGPDAQFRATTPAGWERRIATTGQIVEAAPSEWRDEAETYLQMVKDRAQLASENGYVGVNDLPSDVRNAFITSHRAMQAEVDSLIAYMSAQCRAPGSG